MAEISAKDVMALRNATGLPMMDCKQALMENNGDTAAAEEWLRKKLKGKMETRTDRAAGEGCIAVHVAGDAASIVELRAETDFTARNDQFKATADQVAKAAAQQPAGDVRATDEMNTAVDRIRVSTGENISIARARTLTGGGPYGVYIHHDGKTGVLVQGRGDVSTELLRDIAMHVAASPIRPLGVNPDDVPADVAEKERKFAIDQAMESGKPREIAEKIVEGKMRKFFEESALIEQPFVKDPEKKIKDLLPKGAGLRAFVRWQVGQEA